MSRNRPSSLSRIFIERLKSKEADLRKVASFWNSCEGWLKFELALAMYDRGYRPWHYTDDGPVHGTIGVEYKGTLGPQRESIPAQKQIDLWVSTKKAMAASNDRWDAVELKVAFNNHNARKQIVSWLDDFGNLQLLRRHSRNKVRSAIAVLVAVGFENQSEFRERVKNLCSETPDLHPVVPEYAWFDESGRRDDWCPPVAVVTLSSDGMSA